MYDFITLRQMQMAVALAQALSFEGAAAAVGATVVELRNETRELELTLCLSLFEIKNEALILTREGQIFVDECKTFLKSGDTNNV
jgi:DNA-binding transcriptional LysR family regulator